MGTQGAGSWPRVSESAGLRTCVCENLLADPIAAVGGPQLEAGTFVPILQM